MLSAGEVVKNGNAVGFGPNTDFAGIGEAVVGGFDNFLPIECDGEFVALEINPEPSLTLLLS
jgi:hypothetical protein